MRSVIGLILNMCLQSVSISSDYFYILIRNKIERLEGQKDLEGKILIHMIMILLNFIHGLTGLGATGFLIQPCGGSEIFKT